MSDVRTYSKYSNQLPLTGSHLGRLRGLEAGAQLQNTARRNARNRPGVDGAAAELRGSLDFDAGLAYPGNSGTRRHAAALDEFSPIRHVQHPVAAQTYA